MRRGSLHGVVTRISLFHEQYVMPNGSSDSASQMVSVSGLCAVTVSNFTLVDLLPSPKSEMSPATMMPMAAMTMAVVSATSDNST